MRSRLGFVTIFVGVLGCTDSSPSTDTSETEVFCEFTFDETEAGFVLFQFEGDKICDVTGSNFFDEAN